jgi:DMSO reductase anchor subunit
MSPAELAALKSKISILQVAYVLLFGSSLVILVAQQTSDYRRSPNMTLYFALLLGGAVITRLYRRSLVTKYNNEKAAQAGLPERLL